MRLAERLRRREVDLQQTQRWREPDCGEPGEGGHGVLDCTSNDYLGLAAELVSRETWEQVGEVPPGAGASRLIRGTRPSHRALEAELADWLGQESALLFPSAFTANAGLLPALAREGDLLLSDSLNHASIIDGCRLAKARVSVLPHRSLEALERALETPVSGARWYVTESYFSMDADSPDLARVAALCRRHDAGLIVDEAHALGVFGAEGRGLCWRAGVCPDVVVGGLGKAFGLQGGFVAGSRQLRGLLWNSARSFIFSTATSPWLAEVARERLRRVRAADASRGRLEELSIRLRRRLRECGIQLSADSHGPIVPIVLGTEEDATRAAAALRERGVEAQAIRPPSVPSGSCRLRVTLAATLSQQDADRLAESLVATLAPASRAAGRLRPSVTPSSHSGAAASPVATRPPVRSQARPPRWVVLGCGTEVGKTFATVALARFAAHRGASVAALKPVETGVDGPGGAADAQCLERASFHVKHPTPHPLYAFKDPVTPSLCSRREGGAVDPSRIRRWVDSCKDTDGAEPELIIETAGGVFSPLGDGLTNFDLARALEPARWILVAADRLGVLHEVSSTLLALQSLGRIPDWIVLSSTGTRDQSTGTNLDELRRQPWMAPLAQRLIPLPMGDPRPLERLLKPR